MKRIISVLFVSALLLCTLMLASCDFDIFHKETTTTTPEHVHSFTSNTVAPTCTSEGYTEYVCEGCGYVYQDSFVNPTDTKHQYVKVETVAPTCFTQGYTREVCSICGDENIEYTAPEHKWGNWEEVVHATCTTAGEARRYCQLCTAYDSKEIDPAHSYDMKNGVVTEPTCTSGGYTTYACTECGHTMQDKFTSKLEHEFGSWKTVSTGTCHELGVDKRTCEHCDAYETRYTGYQHDLKMVYVIPTCTEPGCMKYVCNNCDFEQVIEVVTVDHTYGEWKTYIAPTCSTQGLERRYCTCGAFEERITDPEHVYDIVEVVEPTRTSSGYTKHSCECGDCYIDTIVSTAGSEGLEYKLQTVYDSETKTYIKSYVVTGIGECTDTEIVVPYMHDGIVVEGIYYNAFYDLDNITAIYLPASIKSIGNKSLWNCDNLKLINFEGTLDEWDAISKADSWNFGLSALKLVCLDGSRKYD